MRKGNKNLADNLITRYIINSITKNFINTEKNDLRSENTKNLKSKSVKNLAGYFCISLRIPASLLASETLEYC